MIFVLLLDALLVAAPAAEVAVSVQEPSAVARKGWPVTSGVPFAIGALTNDQNVALVTSDGQPVPLQTEVLARWPDGSVRWLLLDFQVDLAANQKKFFTQRYGPAVSRPTVLEPVRVSTRDHRTIIDTGRLRLELSEDGFNPFGAVWADLNGDGKITTDERITADTGGLFVRDPSLRRFAADQASAEIVVEQSGPMRASVRVTGRHADDRGAMFSYVVRLHAFRGQPFVRCSYTFINDQPSALMTSIKELGLTARLAPQAGQAESGILDGRTIQAGRVFQMDERHYERDGQAAGTHAAGWASVAGRRGGFALGLREFWQNWPKAIEVRDGAVTLGICPDFPNGLYDGKPLVEENKLYYALRGGVHTFKVGVAKTHEVWAVFFAGQPDVANLGEFFQAAEEPLLATCEPAYVSDTLAAGEFPPAAAPRKFLGYDAWFDRALTSHLTRRDEVREYGMLNYGDWFGERRVNWGNLEYDLASGMFIQYLRTGERRFFLRGEQAARHHIDVDVVHATNSYLKNPWGAPPKAGEFWVHSLNHTGGYYTNAPLPVSTTYQMGYSADFGHVWINGDLDYYYLTGDRRARDVALLAADAMVSSMPTSYGTHIRDLSWPMILVLAAYEATGDAKYLVAATRNWQVLKKNLDPQRGWVVQLADDHCMHPRGGPRCQGNVPFMEGLTLGGLARYHRLTGDPEVLKAMTVGIDQMIRECWIQDIQTFRYTACPLSPKTTGGFMLSLEAIAYETELTGNSEHRRILKEGFLGSLPKGDDPNGFGKEFGQTTFFAPFALRALEERKP